MGHNPERGLGGETAAAGAQILGPFSDVLFNLNRTLEGLHFTIEAQNRERVYGVTPTAIFADPSRLAREFLGTETPEQARAWLNEFENISRIHEWNDSVTLSVAKEHMKGAALK